MKQTQSDAQTAYAKSFADAAKLSKETLDAVIGNIELATQGYTELSTSWLEFTKAQVADGMVVATALGGCTNPQEAADLQNTYAKASMEKYVSKVNELQEISAKTASQMRSPFGNGLESAFAKFWSAKSAV